MQDEHADRARSGASLDAFLAKMQEIGPALANRELRCDGARCGSPAEIAVRRGDEVRALCRQCQRTERLDAEIRDQKSRAAEMRRRYR
jgi:hypothetical protein